MSGSAVPHEWQEKLGLVGLSPLFLRAVAHVPIVAPGRSTVLIQGESGTGKELFAHAVHVLSGRTGAFVPVNCGAIPAELFERELFGHRRAAFTGAISSEPGLVQAAEEGTLFLDEIDTIPLQTQPKLLRFLQEKEYRPLGASVPLHADVRIVAASNASLARGAHAGTFRTDLYYRLSVLPLHLPPLRKRKEDIALLAEHFLERYSGGGPARKSLSVEALGMLLAHDWPGNVRELQHVIERATAMSSGLDVVEAHHVQLGDEPESALSDHSFHEAKRRAVAAFERAYLEEILAAHAGNITSAAQAAKKNRRAFWELLRKHAIDATRFRRASSSRRAAPRAPDADPEPTRPKRR